MQTNQYLQDKKFDLILISVIRISLIFYSLEFKKGSQDPISERIQPYQRRRISEKNICMFAI